MSDWRDAMFSRVIKVTAVQPPWRQERHACVHLFWRMPIQSHGQSFSGAFHQGCVPQSDGMIAALNPGISEEIQNVTRQVIEIWLKETPARLKNVWPVVEDVCILLVSPEDSQELNSLCSAAIDYAPARGEPWTISGPDDKGSHRRYLIVIPLPQELRRDVELAPWVVAALKHELEHVFQIAAVQRNLVNGWRIFAELCAVWREWSGTSENSAALDYAHSFRTRQSLGLDAPCQNEGYHLHPFCEQLERLHPGVIDALWLRAGKKHENYWAGPLPLLDRMLQERRSSLADAWQSFCLELPFRSRHPLGSVEKQRDENGTAVLPSVAVDLGSPGSGAGQQFAFRIPYLSRLSCHCIVVRPHCDRARTMTVATNPDSCPDPLDLRIWHATSDAVGEQGSEWLRVNQGGELMATITIPPGPDTVRHWFAFVFAGVPLMGLVGHHAAKSFEAFCSADGILSIEFL